MVQVHDFCKLDKRTVIIPVKVDICKHQACTSVVVSPRTLEQLMQNQFQ